MSTEGLIGTGRQGLKATSLNSKAVILALVAVAGALSLVYIYRIQPRELKTTVASKGQASPGYVLASLKSSYADLPQILPLKSLPLKELSDADKLRARLLEEKIKRAEEARRSKLSFATVTDEQIQLPHPVQSKEEQEKSEESDKLSPRDDINRQDEKLSFLTKTKEERTHVNSEVRKQASKFELLAGTVIPGLLLTGINSDLPGEILGQVSSNIFDTATGDYLLVPQGTKILGRYDSRIVYGQERVLIVWKRLVFSDGSSITIENMPGVDAQGYSGLSDSVDNHYLRLLGGVVFSSVLGASAQLASGPNFQTVNPEFGQLAIQGAARNTNEAGQEITRRNLNVQPTIEVRPGYRFNIFVNKDISLKPIQ